MSDTHEVDGDKFQAVIIYYVSDSVGNRAECNMRVSSNYDCSEIYSWEELDIKILNEVKKNMSDKMKDKGIDLNGILIDALIELKRR